jgi:GT2 family glycosyltransferase
MFEIVLVDNGSYDGSVEFLRSQYAPYLEPDSRPYLNLIALPTNTGFAGGNLAGLAACSPTSRYIATLNNDTIADPAWLERLVEALNQKNPPRELELESEKEKNGIEKWGAACGPMLFMDNQNENEPNVQPANPTVAAAGIEVYRNGLALDGKVGQKLNTLAMSTPTATFSEVFGPCAGAALYSRSALAEVGFFDEAFFAYLEDSDLAWRLRLRGWRTLYVPSAQVWHEYSGTGGQGSPFKNFQLGRNRVWTILKNMPTRLLLSHLPAILLYDGAASVYTLSQRKWQPLRGRLAALHPRHLNRVWRQRQQIQRQRTTSLTELAGWLQPSPTLFSNVRLQRKVDTLAIKQP